MKKIIHTRKIFTLDMIQKMVQDILSFWNIDLQQNINIMAIENISKKNRKIIKHKFKECLHYLEKQNILEYVNINKVTFYAIIILFTIYSRCIHSSLKKIYKNDKKIFIFMEIGLKKHNIQVDTTYNTMSYLYSILLPFQVTEEYLQQVQGKEIMYNMLLRSTNIQVKHTLRKIIHFQKKRIEVLDMFQRFPNRNKILKRDFTIEEIDFLDETEYNELKLIF